MPAVTLRPTASTRVVNAQPNTRLGNDLKQLLIQDTVSTSFVKFSLPITARGRQITKAELVLRPIGTGWGSSRTVEVRPSRTGWDFRTITFNNRPADQAGQPVVTKAHTGLGAITLNLIDHLQAWSAGQIELDAWRLSQASGAVSAAIAGSGNGALTPLLRLEWSDRPQAPINLWPEGGVTSLTHPTLAWVSAGPAVTSVQVQFGTVDPITDAWTTVWDSGIRAATSPQFRLAGSGYSGLTGNHAWRVRERWSDGQWTNYSEAVELGYAPYATVTLEPLSTTPDYNPTRVWDADVQATAKITRFGFNSRAVFAESLLLGEDVRAYEPSRGAVKAGQSFIDRLEYLDRPDRLDLAGQGAPAFQILEDSWTYDPTDTTQVIADIRMEQDHHPDLGALPTCKIVITIKDGEALPDQLTIHSGEWSPIRIDTDSGGEFWVGGQTFKVPVYDWPPNTDREVAVSALVGTQRQLPVRATLRTDLVGAWLLHEDDGEVTMVTLDGEDCLQVAEQEQVNEFRVRGGEVVLHRMDRTGKIGTLSGEITRKGNLSVEAQRDAWDEIRDLAYAGEEILVFGSRECFPAHLHTMPRLSRQDWPSTKNIPYRVSAEVRGLKDA